MENIMNPSKAAKTLKLELKKVELEEFDLVLVKYDQSKVGTDHEVDFIHAMNKTLQTTLPPGSRWIVLPNHVELVSLSDDILEAIGLKRIYVQED